QPIQFNLTLGRVGRQCSNLSQRDRSQPRALLQSSARSPYLFFHHATSPIRRDKSLSVPGSRLSPFFRSKSRGLSRRPNRVSRQPIQRQPLSGFMPAAFQTADLTV